MTDVLPTRHVVPDARPVDIVVGREACAPAVAGLGPLDASQHAVCVTDGGRGEGGLRVESANAACLELFCCEVDDLIGECPQFMYGPLTNMSTMRRLRRLLGTGSSARAQSINYRRDGEAFRLRWSIDPICVGVEPVRFVAVLADVTIEDRLRRRLAALDTLQTDWRREVRPAGDVATHCAPDLVQQALAHAVAPLLAEIASASVIIDGCARQPIPVCPPEDTIEPERHVPIERFSVGDIGSVEVAVHPDALRLVDRDAIDEVCGGTAWLTSVAGGLSA